MSARNMLDQLLRSGLEALNNSGGSAAPGTRPADSPAPNTGQRAAPANAKGQTDWGSFGKGAATAGVLALLLGSRQGRRLTGKAVKFGGLAAIGVMAYRAYTQWQQSQQPQQPQPGQPAAGSAAPAPPAAGAAPLALPAPRTIDQALPAEEAETHSRTILMAMVAAAQADGHLDARERGLLDAELARLAGDHGVADWVQNLLSRPLSAAEVARASSGPAMGAEVYLASLLVADEQSPAERRYLDELALHLQLAPELKTRLEAQAAG